VNFKLALALFSFRYFLNAEAICKAMAAIACRGILSKTLVQSVTEKSHKASPSKKPKRTFEKPAWVCVFLKNFIFQKENFVFQSLSLKAALANSCIYTYSLRLNEDFASPALGMIHAPHWKQTVQSLR